MYAHFEAARLSIVLILDILPNMPAVKTLSNFAFRCGFLRLATETRASFGLTERPGVPTYMFPEKSPVPGQEKEHAILILDDPREEPIL